MDARSSESNTGQGASQKCEPVLISTPVTGHGASVGAGFRPPEAIEETERESKEDDVEEAEQEERAEKAD